MGARAIIPATLSVKGRVEDKSLSRIWNPPFTWARSSWLKTIALMRKVRHRGVLKVDWIFTFACAAYNLVRMRNLAVAVPTV